MAPLRVRLNLATPLSTKLSCGLGPAFRSCYVGESHDRKLSLLGKFCDVKAELLDRGGPNSHTRGANSISKLYWN